jgi:hypothetical protein
VRFVPAVPHVIADELRSLVSDRQAWAAAAEAVHRHALQAFGWTQTAERYELLYEQLVAGRRSQVAGGGDPDAQATTASDFGATP